MSAKSAIVGIGESNYYRAGGAPETEFQLAAIAIRNAAVDAGIDVRHIDGFVSYSNDRNVPTRLATALGVDETRFGALAWDAGGNGVATTLQLADAAIGAGHADYIVCYRALAQGEFGRFGQARNTVSKAGGNDAFRHPYGLVVPAHQFAMIAMRYMHEHNISQDALMEISLAAYGHAQHNPRAIRYGRGITEEDYKNSRWIVEPFHLFDCCQENDGSAAVLVTSAERARDMAKKPVYIKATAQGIDYRGAAGGGAPGTGYADPDYPTAHYKTVAKNLWENSGIGPQDVQVAQFYENFTGMTLIALVELGIAPPDEIEGWLKEGNGRWPNGKMPINTSGGNLAEAYIHGFQLVNEAARQVRGESGCQVDHVEHSLVVSGPGALPASAAVLSAAP